MDVANGARVLQHVGTNTDGQVHYLLTLNDVSVIFPVVRGVRRQTDRDTPANYVLESSQTII